MTCLLLASCHVFLVYFVVSFACLLSCLSRAFCRVLFVPFVMSFSCLLSCLSHAFCHVFLVNFVMSSPNFFRGFVEPFVMSSLYLLSCLFRAFCHVFLVSFVVSFSCLLSCLLIAFCHVFPFCHARYLAWKGLPKNGWAVRWRELASNAGRIFFHSQNLTTTKDVFFYDITYRQNGNGPLVRWHFMAQTSGNRNSFCYAFLCILSDVGEREKSAKENAIPKVAK